MKNANDFSDFSNLSKVGNYIDKFTHKIYAASNAIHLLVAEKESIYENTSRASTSKGVQVRKEFQNKCLSKVEATTQTDVCLLYTVTNPFQSIQTDHKEKPRTLCRLCAALVHRDSAIEIYKGFGKLNELNMLMNRIIPNKVKEMDGLPQLVCMSCYEKLNICSIIRDSFLEADKKLRSMLSDQLALMNQNSENPMCVVSGTQGKATYQWRDANSRLQNYRARKVNREREVYYEIDINNLPISPTENMVEEVQEEPQPVLNNAIDEPQSFPDLSVLDPEHDSGLEVEWCLDDEILHTAVTQKYSCTKSCIKHPPDTKITALNSGSHHKLQEYREFNEKCEECSLTFKSIRGLISHKAQVHATIAQSTGVTSVTPKCNNNLNATTCRRKAIEMTPNSDKIEVDSLSITLNLPDFSELVEDSSRNNQDDNLTCFSCSLTFPSKRDAFIHKLTKHSKDIPEKYIAAKSENENYSDKLMFTTNNSQSAASVKQCYALEAANEFGKLQEHKCAICNATFKNEYRLFIHKNLVHEKVLQSDPLTNSEKKGLQKKNTNSVTKSKKKGLQKKNTNSAPRNLSNSSSVKKQAATATVQCPFCVLTFTSQAQLDQHCQVHLKLMCMKCGAVFTCKEELTEHMRSHKSKQESTSLLSNHKSDIPKHKKKSKEILDTQSSTHFNLFLCKICGKMFSQDISLQNHERLHRKSEKSSCSICGETYQDKTLLTIHLKTHIKKDTSIFECSICKKKFFNHSTLHSHRQKCSHKTSYSIIHTEKGYFCNICNKGFLLETNLRQHMVIHTDNVPFQCRQCLKSFSNRTSLITHKGMHKAYATRSIEAVQFHNAIENELRLRHARNKDKLGISCNLCIRLLANMQCLKTHMARHSAKDLFGDFQHRRTANKNDRVGRSVHKTLHNKINLLKDHWHNDTVSRDDKFAISTFMVHSPKGVSGSFQREATVASSGHKILQNSKDVFGDLQLKSALSRTTDEMGSSSYMVQHSMKTTFGDFQHKSVTSDNRMANSVQLIVHDSKDLHDLQPRNIISGIDETIVGLAPTVEYSAKSLFEGLQDKGTTDESDIKMDSSAHFEEHQSMSLLSNFQHKNTASDSEHNIGISRVLWNSENNLFGDLQDKSMTDNNYDKPVSSAQVELPSEKASLGSLQNKVTTSGNEARLVASSHTSQIGLDSEKDLFSDLEDKSATSRSEGGIISLAHMKVNTETEW